MYTALFANNLKSFQQEIKLLRAGRLENLLVRMAPMKDEDDKIDGFVVAFDDVTQLVSAQRAAAWGDVAQRIAHEIKNPLTPIRLSAERIKRKFMPLVNRESDTLADMTEVIVRQTNDLSRIVDEFSKFARMPEPDKQSEDIIKIVNSAISLQQSGFPEILFKRNIVEGPIMFELDATMMSQAFINLLKNAGESIESRQNKDESSEVKGQIDIIVERHDTFLEVSVVDNGIGLPADRARLFEPYVTTRENGTGLGLAIVKKIIEEHGGTFRLEDAPKYKNSSKVGAAAIIELPYFTMSRIETKTWRRTMKDILIVDDERDIRELISEILIDEGYQTRLCGSADECLQELKKSVPGLLILDIWLKDNEMDGIDILVKAKREFPSSGCYNFRAWKH